MAVKKIKLDTAAFYLSLAFRAVKLDCTSADMQETPTRVAKWLADLAQNQGQLPKLTTEAVYDANKRIKLTTFDGTGLDELVVYSNVEFQSSCSHHLLPFSGVVSVGYLPNGKIIGASKIPRLVDFFSRQPTTQEYLTQRLATYLKELTNARFVGVMMSASHSCVSCRGVRKQGMVMRTSCFMPSDNHTLKAEFMHQSGK